MKQILGFLLFVLLGIGNVLAQNDTSHRAIGEVAIVASSTKYQYGAHVEQFDSSQLARINDASLASLMQNIAGVYVKQDASGLATIKLRGTDANHTAVLIDGVNINSLTLGHSNVSAVPLWLFDNVSLQYGGASSLLGTDAIGGAIQLNNTAKWNKGLHINTKVEYGSLSRQFYGAKLQYSNNKTSNDFRIYYTSCKNNFIFANTEAQDLFTKKIPQDTQRNAAYANWGLINQFGYKVNNQLTFDFKTLYTSNSHQIQPNMSTNFYGGTLDSLSDKYMLLLASAKYKTDRLSLQYSAGDAYSKELYFSGASPSKIATNQIINNILSEYALNEQSIVRLGANTVNIRPQVYAYKENLTETRLDPFVSWAGRVGSRLRISANVRSSFVTGYRMPFAPSLGLDFLIFSNTYSKFSTRASISRSFKIPTFNQRFWDKVGNPNLLPEYSIGGDAGLVYAFCSAHRQLQTSLTLYNIVTDNLIQWIQLDTWRPVNVQQVQSYGVEYSIKAEQQQGLVLFKESLQYTFNTAIATRYATKPELEGRLLSYSPQHLASCNLSAQYKHIELILSASYTDLRYTDDRKVLPTFVLYNSKLQYYLCLQKHRIDCYVAADNILNTAYQHQLAYAMPGRLMRIGLSYTF